MATLTTETWTGTDGAAWPAQWALGLNPTGGGATIVGNAGRLATGTAGAYAGAARVARRYNVNVTDAEATGRFRFVAGESYPLVLFRADSLLETQTGYALRIQTDGVQWESYVGYTGTLLGSKLLTTFTVGTWYRYRARVVGSELKAKVWADGAAEPTEYASGLSVTSTTITAAGAFGFSVGTGSAATSSTVDVDDLILTDGAVAATPTGTIPLKVGTGAATALRLGSTPVKALYMGTSLFYALPVAGSPSIPTQVTTTQTSSTATLNWQPPASDGGSAITGYRVGRNGTDSTGAGAYTAVVGAAVRSTVFNNLTPQTYTLTVSAITGTGESATVGRSVTIAAPVITPGTGLSALSGLAWGSGAFTMHSDSNRLALESARGRPLDVYTAYTSRATWVSNRDTFWNPPSTYTGYIDLAIPLIPLNEGTIADAASGAYNSLYLQWGQAIAATGRGDKMILRPGWEMNLHAGYRYSCLVGQETNWREAFRQLVTQMRAAMPNVKVTWCPNAGTSESGTVVNPYPDAYPGDTYVDYIGPDSYNWYPVVTTAAEWAAHRDKFRGLTDYLALAVSRGKKFALPEWGTYPAVFPTSDDADYIQAQFDWFVANASNIAYESYFNEVADYYKGAVEPPISPNAAVRYKSLY